MEEYSDCKTVLIHYKCDNCNVGYLECIDSYYEKDDNGDTHQINTHRCSNCGATIDLEDIMYPYTKIVSIGDIKPLGVIS